MLRYFTHICIMPILLGFSQILLWRPCQEVSPTLRQPCRCNLESIEQLEEKLAVNMNCDGVGFSREALNIQNIVQIVSFSQRFSGHQVLESQVFGFLELPIKFLDISSNSIRRLPRNVFHGVKKTLTKLTLSNNLLGDNLNPIFSSPEFHILKKLKILDLSANKIRSIEEGLLKGCDKLEELYLAQNYLTTIPTGSINGPFFLKLLSLESNRIIKLNFESFLAQPNLTSVNLRNNNIKAIEGSSFQGPQYINSLFLSGNKITTLNSDVFKGLLTLEHLDLSKNFIREFPTFAFVHSGHLKFLNLSSNMIQQLNCAHLQPLDRLQILDLSRNNIKTIPTGTFRYLGSLKLLDLSLNSLRTIEDDAFEGLQNLQTLKIQDNNILLVPGSALGRLSNIKRLELDFNRIAALSSEILASIYPNINYLSLSRNLIRELPSESFQTFKKLEFLDLSGNSLAAINNLIFIGLEKSLLELRLSQNKITGFSVPLRLMHLEILDLSDNKISDISLKSFIGLENVIYLNISGNSHLYHLPSLLFKPLTKLQVIDLSRCNLKIIPGELFGDLMGLKKIFLGRNLIQELKKGTFKDLQNITLIDISYNNLTTINSLAFINVMNIKRLSFKGNMLKDFKGEIFNTGTSLEEIDISDNMLDYLFPSSFRIHPRLKILKVSNNNLSLFPSELILSLQYLEEIDISKNVLKNVDELNFARLPCLRILNMANNFLVSLSEMTFHNSSQLQIINLSFNKLERFGERTFEGLFRIHSLNLEGNLLSELPESLFESSRLNILENINLARNKFFIAPLNALDKQYNFLSSVDLSYNYITDIAGLENMFTNVINLDLSFNPLTNVTIFNILNQPKIVRKLNLAGTDISCVKSIETPFLQYLNLSFNKLLEIDENFFQRTTLLETLDLSHNLIKDLEKLSKSWNKLNLLKNLKLSNNSFEIIATKNFQHLDTLTSLSISNLINCTKIEKNAFKNLPNLIQLSIFGLPLLGYLDLQGILDLLPGLIEINIEVKDPFIGSDQIQLNNHPRLSFICLKGHSLKNISAGILGGFKNRNLIIKIEDNSITTLPAAFMAPIPRSTYVSLDITGSRITTLSTQLLSSLEDRRSTIKLTGLSSNPIHCDCNARALRRWLKNSQIKNIKCHSPNVFQNKLLVEVGDDKLTCPSVKSNSLVHKLLPKLDNNSFIKESSKIWEMEPVIFKPKKKSPQINQPISNDITLIIGIAGGVVAFIALLIIVICIIRLKLSSTQFQSGPVIAPPFTMSPNNMQISYNVQQPSTYCLASQNFSPSLTNLSSKKFGMRSPNFHMFDHHLQ